MMESLCEQAMDTSTRAILSSARMEYTVGYGQRCGDWPMPQRGRSFGVNTIVPTPL
jgi:hypothetical protein